MGNTLTGPPEMITDSHRAREGLVGHVRCGLRTPREAKNSPKGGAALLWDTGSGGGCRGALSSEWPGQFPQDSNPVLQTPSRRQHLQRAGATCLPSALSVPSPQAPTQTSLLWGAPHPVLAALSFVPWSWPPTAAWVPALDEENSEKMQTLPSSRGCTAISSLATEKL